MSSPHVNSFQTGRRVWCWWKANESAYGGNEGVKASDPVEEDAGSPGETDGLAHRLQWNSSCLCRGFPKLLSQTQKFTIKKM